eukprot:15973991-Heterocapsa_arctica.AAC.1
MDMASTIAAPTKTMSSFVTYSFHWYFTKNGSTTAQTANQIKDDVYRVRAKNMYDQVMQRREKEKKGKGERRG